jgi:hypothetical protein
MMANAIQMVSPTLCFVSLAAYVSDLATATLSEPILQQSWIVVEGDPEVAAASRRSAGTRIVRYAGQKPASSLEHLRRG